jgi:hypothetical protein
MGFLLWIQSFIHYYYYSRSTNYEDGMAGQFSVLAERRSAVLKWSWGKEVLANYIEMTDDWSRSQYVGYFDSEYYLPYGIMQCHQE